MDVNIAWLLQIKQSRADELYVGGLNERVTISSGGIANPPRIT